MTARGGAVAFSRSCESGCAVAYNGSQCQIGTHRYTEHRIWSIHTGRERCRALCPSDKSNREFRRSEPIADVEHYVNRTSDEDR